MFDPIPSDVAIGGMYFAPALLVGVFGLVAASLAAKVLNRTGLSRFVWHPPLAFLSLWVLASALISFLFLRP